MRVSQGYGISPAVVAGRAVLNTGALLHKQRKSTSAQDNELRQYREALQDPGVIRQLEELGMGADSVGHAIGSRQHAYAPETRQQSFAGGRDLQCVNGRPAQSAQLPRKSGQPANQTQVEELADPGRRPRPKTETQVEDLLGQQTDPGRPRSDVNARASPAGRSPEEIVARMLADVVDEDCATDGRATAKLATGRVDDLLLKVASIIGDEADSMSAKARAERQQKEVRGQKLRALLRQEADADAGKELR